MKVCPVLSNRVGLEKKDFRTQNNLKYLNDCFERSSISNEKPISFGFGGISPKAFESKVIEGVGIPVLNGKISFSERIKLTVAQFADLVLAIEAAAFRTDDGKFGRLIKNEYAGIEKTSLFNQIMMSAKTAAREKWGNDTGVRTLDIVVNT